MAMASSDDTPFRLRDSLTCYTTFNQETPQYKSSLFSKSVWPQTPTLEVTKRMMSKTQVIAQANFVKGHQTKIKCIGSKTKEKKQKKN